MATPSPISLLFLCSLFLLVSSSLAKTSPQPKALLLSVSKDPKTLQYITQISQRTPLVNVKLTLDLGGDFMWVNCERGYNSSTYRLAPCGSAPCLLVNATDVCTTECFPPAEGCNLDACVAAPTNTVANTGLGGPVSVDVFKIQSTNGKNIVGAVSVPRFTFVCGNNFVEGGLASGVTGMAGLGRAGASLPAQLASYFRFDRKFAVCLSSSTQSSGVVIFGNGPYTFLPNVDASSALTYTPLFLNPFIPNGFSGDPSAKYFIGVKSIKINGKRVSLNETLLTIDSRGTGGTSISTVDPYTVMERSIYHAVLAAFVKAMPKNVERVPNVAPFGACFRSKNIGRTRLGPAVPSIDLVLQNESVYWRIFGANSMVEVNKDVLCLGFVEALSIFQRDVGVVIGAHQIEDNLLQFDLSKSRVGFSSSLLGRSTTCANFNFTSSS